jgi:RNA polymerase sigma-70 factor (ECF subfamily)
MSQLAPEVENGLLEKARRGDAEAFGALYEAYAPAVFRFLFSHLDDRLDAEDLTEEVFLRVWQSLPRYQPRGLPFASFLFRAARNGLYDHYRQAGRRGYEQRIEDHDDDRRDLPAGEDSDPAHALHVAHERDRLRSRLQHLGEDQRLVVSLRFLAGLSYEETALALGKSEGAVRVIQHRALTALKKLLEES